MVCYKSLTGVAISSPGLRRPLPNAKEYAFEPDIGKLQVRYRITGAEGTAVDMFP